MARAVPESPFFVGNSQLPVAKLLPRALPCHATQAMASAQMRHALQICKGQARSAGACCTNTASEVRESSLANHSGLNTVLAISWQFCDPLQKAWRNPTPSLPTPPLLSLLQRTRRRPVLELLLPHALTSLSVFDRAIPQLRDAPTRALGFFMKQNPGTGEVGMSMSGQ